jgi:hypothetical protein
MVKYITLTDATGQEVPIPLQGLAHIDTTNSSQLTLRYLSASSAPILIVIAHVADVTTHQWKLFMTQQVEKALASNWRQVESKPTPPTAITGIAVGP